MGHSNHNPRSRNAYNNIKQLTTGSKESSTSVNKHKTMQMNHSPTNPMDHSGESRNNKYSRFNTLEQGNSGNLNNNE